ncbi:MAG: hypothetical protein ACIAS6_01085 [Phycisphaerales bacterium JB060]
MIYDPDIRDILDSVDRVRNAYAMGELSQDEYRRTSIRLVGLLALDPDGADLAWKLLNQPSRYEAPVR